MFVVKFNIIAGLILICICDVVLGRPSVAGKVICLSLFVLITNYFLVGKYHAQYMDMFLGRYILLNWL